MASSGSPVLPRPVITVARRRAYVLLAAAMVFFLSISAQDWSDSVLTLLSDSVAAVNRLPPAWVRLSMLAPAQPASSAEQARAQTARGAGRFTSGSDRWQCHRIGSAAAVCQWTQSDRRGERAQHWREGKADAAAGREACGALRDEGEDVGEVWRWCPGSDSNRHALRRGILSPLRLPVSPPGQV
ncbi:exported hypothetical protein [Cupriavidus taiwanensis]|uniref:Uncharacterized protein n=1 Tax=Cupriavidus taiwanensis TaxID=164546 RepID=A0A375BNW8_9BURK|nr:exported hypothetical protein [Cupriavidus taiwanensis]